jgi:hypothetical protein
LTDLFGSARKSLTFFRGAPFATLPFHTIKESLSPGRQTLVLENTFKTLYFWIFRSILWDYNVGVVHRESFVEEESDFDEGKCLPG